MWLTLEDKTNSSTSEREITIGTKDSTGADYWLCFGVNERGLFVCVYWNIEVGYSVKPPVSWKIDNGPWRRRKGWSLSVDHKGTHIPQNEVRDIFLALSGAETFLARVYPFGKNPLAASFLVHGFDEVCSVVIEAELQNRKARAAGALGRAIRL